MGKAREFPLSLSKSRPLLNYRLLMSVRYLSLVLHRHHVEFGIWVPQIVLRAMLNYVTTCSEQQLMVVSLNSFAPTM